MDKQQKIIISVLCVVLALLLAFTLIILIHGPFTYFEPPLADENAQTGIPQLTEGTLGSITGGPGFRFLLAKEPMYENGKVALYFTSPETNTVWMVAELCDANGNTIGKSGLLRPGEYVESITVYEDATVGEAITVRILSYEPDTYYSMGSVNVDLPLRK